MTRPFKHPKTGVYWLRKRVPEDLRQAVGRAEITRTLGTKDPSEAKAKLADALSELEAQWANLRRGPVELTETQTHHLASPIFAEWTRRYADNPSEQSEWDTKIGNDGLWDPSTVAKSFAPAATSRVISRLQAYCYSEADALLAAAGYQTGPKSRDRLARAVGAAVQRACLALQRAARGEQLDIASFPILPSSSPSHSKYVGIDQLVKDWAAERRPSKKTLYEWTRVLNELKTFLGHDNAAQVTSVHLNNWKAALLAENRRPKTIRDAKIAPVRAIFQWGVDNDKLASNPAARVVIEVKEIAKERKRGFTDAEAVLVLQSARKERNPVLRWIPWLCAFTGARVAEPCQLRREDILKVGDIWCLQFTSEAGPLKTASSERTVPIHSALIDEGFLKFVETVASGPLFKDLSPDKFDSRGGNGTKMVGRWIRGLGIIDGRISPNHSCRHRFKTSARLHEVRADIGDAIVGHGKQSVGDGYGEFPMPAMKREIEKIPSPMRLGGGI